MLQRKRDIYYIAFRLRINTKAPFKRYKEIKTKGLSKRDKFLQKEEVICALLYYLPRNISNKFSTRLK